MMSNEVVDPSTGTELFVEQDGERRIPWEVLEAADLLVVHAFVAALKRYAEEHPRLRYRIENHPLTDELVIRWRWHR